MNYLIFFIFWINFNVIYSDQMQITNNFFDDNFKIKTFNHYEQFNEILNSKHFDSFINKSKNQNNLMEYSAPKKELNEIHLFLTRFIQSLYPSFGINLGAQSTCAIFFKNIIYGLNFNYEISSVKPITKSSFILASTNEINIVNNFKVSMAISNKNNIKILQENSKDISYQVHFHKLIEKHVFLSDLYFCFNYTQGLNLYYIVNIFAKIFNHFIISFTVINGKEYDDENNIYLNISFMIPLFSYLFKFNIFLKIPKTFNAKTILKDINFIGRMNFLFKGSDNQYMQYMYLVNIIFNDLMNQIAQTEISDYDNENKILNHLLDTNNDNYLNKCLDNWVQKNLKEVNKNNNKRVTYIVEDNELTTLKFFNNYSNLTKYLDETIITIKNSNSNIKDFLNEYFEQTYNTFQELKDSYIRYNTKNTKDIDKQNIKFNIEDKIFEINNNYDKIITTLNNTTSDLIIQNFMKEVIDFRSKFLWDTLNIEDYYKNFLSIIKIEKENRDKKEPLINHPNVNDFFKSMTNINSSLTQENIEILTLDEKNKIDSSLKQLFQDKDYKKKLENCLDNFQTINNFCNTFINCFFDANCNENIKNLCFDLGENDQRELLKYKNESISHIIEFLNQYEVRKDELELFKKGPQYKKIIEYDSAMRQHVLNLNNNDSREAIKSCYIFILQTFLEVNDNKLFNNKIMYTSKDIGKPSQHKLIEDNLFKYLPEGIKCKIQEEFQIKVTFYLDTLKNGIINQEIFLINNILNFEQSVHYNINNILKNNFYDFTKDLENFSKLFQPEIFHSIPVYLLYLIKDNVDLKNIKDKLFITNKVLNHSLMNEIIIYSKDCYFKMLKTFIINFDSTSNKGINIFIEDKMDLSKDLPTNFPIKYLFTSDIDNDYYKKIKENFNIIAKINNKTIEVVEMLKTQSINKDDNESFVNKLIDGVKKIPMKITSIINKSMGKKQLFTTEYINNFYTENINHIQYLSQIEKKLHWFKIYNLIIEDLKNKVIQGQIIKINIIENIFSYVIQQIQWIKSDEIDKIIEPILYALYMNINTFQQNTIIKNGILYSCDLITNKNNDMLNKLNTLQTMYKYIIEHPQEINKKILENENIKIINDDINNNEKNKQTNKSPLFIDKFIGLNDLFNPEKYDYEFKFRDPDNSLYLLPKKENFNEDNFHTEYLNMKKNLFLYECPINLFNYNELLNFDEVPVNSYLNSKKYSDCNKKYLIDKKLAYLEKELSKLLSLQQDNKQEINNSSISSIDLPKKIKIIQNLIYSGKMMDVILYFKKIIFQIDYIKQHELSKDVDKLIQKVYKDNADLLSNKFNNLFSHYNNDFSQNIQKEILDIIFLPNKPISCEEKLQGYFTFINKMSNYSNLFKSNNIIYIDSSLDIQILNEKEIDLEIILFDENKQKEIQLNSLYDHYCDSYQNCISHYINLTNQFKMIDEKEDKNKIANLDFTINDNVTMAAVLKDFINLDENYNNYFTAKDNKNQLKQIQNTSVNDETESETNDLKTEKNNFIKFLKNYNNLDNLTSINNTRLLTKMSTNNFSSAEDIEKFLNNDPQEQLYDTTIKTKEKVKELMESSKNFYYDYAEENNRNKIDQNKQKFILILNKLTCHLNNFDNKSVKDDFSELLVESEIDKIDSINQLFVDLNQQKANIRISSDDQKVYNNIKTKIITLYKEIIQCKQEKEKILKDILIANQSMVNLNKQEFAKQYIVIIKEKIYDEDERNIISLWLNPNLENKTNPITEDIFDFMIEQIPPKNLLTEDIKKKIKKFLEDKIKNINKKTFIKEIRQIFYDNNIKVKEIIPNNQKPTLEVTKYIQLKEPKNIELHKILPLPQFIPKQLNIIDKSKDQKMKNFIKEKREHKIQKQQELESLNFLQKLWNNITSTQKESINDDENLIEQYTQKINKNNILRNENKRIKETNQLEKNKFEEEQLKIEKINQSNENKNKIIQEEYEKELLTIKEENKQIIIKNNTIKKINDNHQIEYNIKLNQYNDIETENQQHKEDNNIFNQTIEQINKYIIFYNKLLTNNFINNLNNEYHNLLNKKQFPSTIPQYTELKNIANFNFEDQAKVIIEKYKKLDTKIEIDSTTNNIKNYQDLKINNLIVQWNKQFLKLNEYDDNFIKQLESSNIKEPFFDFKVESYIDKQLSYGIFNRYLNKFYTTQLNYIFEKNLDEKNFDPSLKWKNFIDKIKDNHNNQIIQNELKKIKIIIDFSKAIYNFEKLYNVTKQKMMEDPNEENMLFKKDHFKIINELTSKITFEKNLKNLNFLDFLDNNKEEENKEFVKLLLLSEISMNNKFDHDKLYPLINKFLEDFKILLNLKILLNQESATKDDAIFVHNSQTFQTRYQMKNIYDCIKELKQNNLRFLHEKYLMFINNKSTILDTIFKDEQFTSFSDFVVKFNLLELYYFNKDEINSDILKQDKYKNLTKDILYKYIKDIKKENLIKIKSLDENISLNYIKNIMQNLEKIKENPMASSFLETFTKNLNKNCKFYNKNSENLKDLHRVIQKISLGQEVLDIELYLIVDIIYQFNKNNQMQSKMDSKVQIDTDIINCINNKKDFFLSIDSTTNPSDIDKVEKDCLTKISNLEEFNHFSTFITNLNNSKKKIYIIDESLLKNPKILQNIKHNELIEIFSFNVDELTIKELNKTQYKCYEKYWNTLIIPMSSIQNNYFHKIEINSRNEVKEKYYDKISSTAINFFDFYNKDQGQIEVSDDFTFHKNKILEYSFKMKNAINPKYSINNFYSQNQVLNNDFIKNLNKLENKELFFLDTIANPTGYFNNFKNRNFFQKFLKVLMENIMNNFQQKKELLLLTTSIENFLFSLKEYIENLENNAFYKTIKLLQTNLKETLINIQDVKLLYYQIETTGYEFFNKTKFNNIFIDIAKIFQQKFNILDYQNKPLKKIVTKDYDFYDFSKPKDYNIYEKNNQIQIQIYDKGLNESLIKTNFKYAYSEMIDNISNVFFKKSTSNINPILFLPFGHSEIIEKMIKSKKILLSDNTMMFNEQQISLMEDFTYMDDKGIGELKRFNHNKASIFYEFVELTSLKKIGETIFNDNYNKNDNLSSEFESFSNQLSLFANHMDNNDLSEEEKILELWFLIINTMINKHKELINIFTSMGKNILKKDINIIYKLITNIYTEINTLNTFLFFLNKDKTIDKKIINETNLLINQLILEIKNIFNNPFNLNLFELIQIKLKEIFFKYYIVLANIINNIKIITKDKANYEIFNNSFVFIEKEFYIQKINNIFNKYHLYEEYNHLLIDELSLNIFRNNIEYLIEKSYIIYFNKLQQWLYNYEYEFNYNVLLRNSSLYIKELVNNKTINKKMWIAEDQNILFLESYNIGNEEMLIEEKTKEVKIKNNFKDTPIPNSIYYKKIENKSFDDGTNPFILHIFNSSKKLDDIGKNKYNFLNNFINEEFNKIKNFYEEIKDDPSNFESKETLIKLINNNLILKNTFLFKNFNDNMNFQDIVLTNLIDMSKNEQLTLITIQKELIKFILDIDPLINNQLSSEINILLQSFPTVNIPTDFETLAFENFLNHFKDLLKVLKIKSEDNKIFIGGSMETFIQFFLANKSKSNILFESLVNNIENFNGNGNIVLDKVKKFVTDPIIYRNFLKGLYIGHDIFYFVNLIKYYRNLKIQIENNQFNLHEILLLKNISNDLNKVLLIKKLNEDIDKMTNILKFLIYYNEDMFDEEDDEI